MKKAIELKKEPDESIVRGTLTYLLPSLAVLGGLLPGVGPFFAFRIAVAVYAIVTLIGLKQRTLIRPNLGKQVIVVSAVWLLTLMIFLILKGIAPYSEAEILSVSFGLVLVSTIMLGPMTTIVLRRWTRGWLIAYFITVIVAFREILLGVHLSNYYVYNLDLSEWSYTGAIAATLGNPNNYAFFLVGSLLVLSIGWKLSRSKIEKSFFAISLAMLPVLIFQTESRIGAFLIILIGGVYLLLWKRWLLFIVLPVFLATVIVTIIDPNMMLAALGIDDDIQTQASADASFNVRLNLFLNGLDFARTTNLIGIGPGAFEYQMSLGRPYDASGVLSPHSAFIELYAQYGLICTIIVLLLLIKLLVIAYGTWKIAGYGTIMRVTGLTLIMAVVSLPVLTLTSSSTFDLSFFWLYMGVLLFAGAILEKQKLITSLSVTRL